MGLKLSIDDFGTGFSSLSYLTRLPVDALKIDKSFVIDMHDDAGNAAIVRSVIDMAHHMGLKVVAEGIETQEAVELLARLGCDLAQGYFIGRPMEEMDFLEGCHAVDQTTNDLPLLPNFAGAEADS